MKKTLVLALSIPLALALIALFAVLAAAPPGVYAAEAKTLDGKQIFLAQKCNLCHSVSSAGITQTSKMKAPDLTGLASKLDAQKLNDFLRKKTDIGGKKHPKEFTGSDEEIGALIAWLQKQEKK